MAQKTGQGGEREKIFTRIAVQPSQDLAVLDRKTMRKVDLNKSKVLFGKDAFLQEVPSILAEAKSLSSFSGSDEEKLLKSPKTVLSKAGKQYKRVKRY